MTKAFIIDRYGDFRKLSQETEAEQLVQRELGELLYSFLPRRPLPRQQYAAELSMLSLVSAISVPSKTFTAIIKLCNTFLAARNGGVTRIGGMQLVSFLVLPPNARQTAICIKL